jgi:uncharacterized protein (UPF0335 family)
MPRKTTEPSGVDVQPSSLTELEPLVKEFVEKYETITNEEELLKTDKKELIEEYSEKLDMKTLQLALRAIKLKSKVQHANTFDCFMEILERSTT